MNNIVFCTLAYGEKYISFSKNLISQITNHGHHFMVYTDKPEKYKKIDLLTIIKNNNKYFSFHQKLEIIKEAFKNYETVIFLDSDVEIINKDIDFTVFESIEPGFHVVSTFGTLNNFFLNDNYTKRNGYNTRNAKYGIEGLKFLEKNNLKYKKIYNGDNEDYLEHFLEGKWLIRKNNGKEKEFIRIWELLRDFSEPIDINLNYHDNIGAGEGSHISIAAYNSGIKLHVLSPITEFMKKNFISNYQEKLLGEKPWDAAG